MPKPHSSRANKPSKPYPDFPPYTHGAGVWAIKIRGKVHYFGPWDEPDGAINSYLARKDDLHAGRMPRPDTASTTVKDMVNAFLNFKRGKRENGELSRALGTATRKLLLRQIAELDPRQAESWHGDDLFLPNHLAIWSRALQESAGRPAERGSREDGAGGAKQA